MTVIESEPLKTQWASNQIRKIAGWACAVNAGNVSPHRRLQRKPLVSDPGMRHGTCVTHVPWCMSGSLTCGGGGNVPGIPGACAPTILRIWQEAHVNRIRWRSEASIVYFCTEHILVVSIKNLLLQYFLSKQLTIAGDPHHPYGTNGSRFDTSYTEWWRHQMETFSALPTLCEGNPQGKSPVDFLTKVSVAELWCFL